MGKAPKPWTVADDARLRQMDAANQPLASMARDLLRTVPDVQARLITVRRQVSEAKNAR